MRKYFTIRFFTDFPLVHLNKSVEKLICSVVKLCSEKTQRAFMEACIKSTISDMAKGMYLQILTLKLFS